MWWRISYYKFVYLPSESYCMWLLHPPGRGQYEPEQHVVRDAAAHNQNITRSMDPMQRLNLYRHVKQVGLYRPMREPSTRRT